MPFEPPREGIEPEQTSIQRRYYGNRPIRSADVREFMSKDGAQIPGAPRMPRLGQKDDGLEESDGDGDPYERGLNELRRSAPKLKRLEHLIKYRRFHLRARSFQTPHAPMTDPCTQ